jgi:hypothetical protein
MNSKQQETNMQLSRLKRLGLAAGLLVLTGGAQAALGKTGVSAAWQGRVF